MRRTAAQDVGTAVTLSYIIKSSMMHVLLMHIMKEWFAHNRAARGKELSESQRAELAKLKARTRERLKLVIATAVVLATGITMTKRLVQRYGAFYVADLLLWMGVPLLSPEARDSMWFTMAHVGLISIPVVDIGMRHLVGRVLERQERSRTGLYAGDDEAFLVHASKLIDYVSFFLPRRIAREDLGDLLEVVRRDLASGDDRATVAGRIAIALGYAFLATAKYFLTPLMALIKLSTFLLKWWR